VETETVHAVTNANIFHLAAFHHRAVLVQDAHQLQFHARQRFTPVAGRVGDDLPAFDLHAGQVAAKFQQHVLRGRIFPQAAIAAHCGAKLGYRHRAGHGQHLVHSLGQAMLADAANTEPARLLVEPGEPFNLLQRLADQLQDGVGALGRYQLSHVLHRGQAVK